MLRNNAGVRWDQFVRKEDIRARLCQPPVSLKMKGARLKWFRYFAKIGGERPVKRIMKGKMQGRRPVAKPTTKWKDVHETDLKKGRLSLEEAVTEALDLERWRTIVQASCDYSAVGN